MNTITTNLNVASNVTSNVTSNSIPNTPPASEIFSKYDSTYKLPIRLNKGDSTASVTSISINSKLLSLWLLMLLVTDEKETLLKKFSKPSSLKTFISDFVYKSLKDWNKPTGKGLSDFISSCIFIDICNKLNIQKEDFLSFSDNILLTVFE